MDTFSQALDTITAKHKIDMMHRGEMDKHSQELKMLIASAAPSMTPKLPLSREVFGILEDNNYHFLNQALEQMGYFEKEG
jgi:hypothetical protein